MGRRAESHRHPAIRQGVSTEIFRLIERLQPLGHDELPVIGIFLFHHAIKRGLMAIEITISRTVTLHLTVSDSHRRVRVGREVELAIHLEHAPHIDTASLVISIIKAGERFIQRLFLRLDRLSKEDHRVVRQPISRRIRLELVEILVTAKDRGLKQMIDETIHVAPEILSNHLQIGGTAAGLHLGKIILEDDLGDLLIHSGRIILIGKTEIPLLQLGHQFRRFLLILIVQGLNQSLRIGRDTRKLNTPLQRLAEHHAPEPESLTFLNDPLQLSQSLRIGGITLLLGPGQQFLLLLTLHLLEVPLIDRPVAADRTLVRVGRARVFAGILDADLIVLQHLLEHRLLTQLTDMDTNRVLNITPLGHLPRGIILVGTARKTDDHGIIIRLDPIGRDLQPTFRAQGHIVL